MQIVTCPYCGIVADYEKCKELYGKKEDGYGIFTKCPLCENCLYDEETSKCAIKFEKEKYFSFYN